MINQTYIYIYIIFRMIINREIIRISYSWYLTGEVIDNRYLLSIFVSLSHHQIEQYFNFFFFWKRTTNEWMNGFENDWNSISGNESVTFRFFFFTNFHYDWLFTAPCNPLIVPPLSFRYFFSFSFLVLLLTSFQCWNCFNDFYNIKWNS